MYRLKSAELVNAMRRKAPISVLIVVALVVLSGLIVKRTNPPIRNSVQWDSRATEEQFRRSCANCHSHETDWPWYAYVGPTAFLVVHNVNEGREHFNISMPNMGEAHESSKAVIEGEMPPSDYLLLHPEASLNESQRRSFAQGLQATFGVRGDGVREHDED